MIFQWTIYYHVIFYWTIFMYLLVCLKKLWISNQKFVIDIIYLVGSRTQYIIFDSIKPVSSIIISSVYVTQLLDVDVIQFEKAIKWYLYFIKPIQVITYKFYCYSECGMTDKC